MRAVISLPTLNRQGFFVTWLSKWKEYQRSGVSLDLWHRRGVDSLPPIEDIYHYQPAFLRKEPSAVRTKFAFILFSLTGNFQCLTKIGKIIWGKYRLIISPAATLDLVICPWVVKIIKPRIFWGVTFDNVVPLKDPGNKLMRFLAWLFFQMSVFLLKRADLIFVISQDLKKYLIKRGFRAEKLVITGNGLEADLIKRAKRDKRYRIDALFVGRINETKGIDDMLKVLDIVRRKYPRFRLAIMGRGDAATEKKYRRKIKKMGLEKNIQFLGYRKGQEKFNIIKSSRCFWFLSKSESESFGIALLEAVCCGLPAFAYDLKPFRTIYKKNEIMTFKIGDYRAVARAVINLFSQKKFPSPQAEELLEKYRWEKIAQIELKAINRLLAK